LKSNKFTDASFNLLKEALSKNESLNVFEFTGNVGVTENRDSELQEIIIKQRLRKQNVPFIKIKEQKEEVKKEGEGEAKKEGEGEAAENNAGEQEAPDAPVEEKKDEVETSG